MSDYVLWKAAPDVEGQEPHEDTTSQLSVSFRISLSQRAMRGNITMSKTTTGHSVPKRASLVQSTYAAPPTQTFTDEDTYADDVPLNMSTLGNTVYTPTTRRTTRGNTAASPHVTHQLTQAPTRPLQTTHRVSGTTRLLLWIVLVLCCAFLFDGVIVPIGTNVINHVKYGNDMISAYDMQGKHFVTQDANNRISVLVSNEDGSRPQLITTVVSGNTDRALISLVDVGSGKIAVEVNGTTLTYIQRDSKGGYSWTFR